MAGFMIAWRSRRRRGNAVFRHAVEHLEQRRVLSGMSFAGIQFVSPTIASATVSAEYRGPGREQFPPQTKTATWNASGVMTPPGTGGSNSLSAASQACSGDTSVTVNQVAGTSLVTLMPSVLTWNGRASARVVSGTGAGTPVTVKIMPAAGVVEGDMVKVTLSAVAFGTGPVVDDSFNLRYRVPDATSFTTLAAGVFPREAVTKTATFSATVGDEFQLQYLANASSAITNHNGHPASFMLQYSLMVMKREPTLVVSASSVAKPDGQGRFWITNPGSGKPAMPKMTFEIDDLPANLPKDLTVTWTTQVSLPAGASPGGRAVAGMTRTATTIGFEYTPDFEEIVGGDIDVTARFTFKGKTYTVSSEKLPETRNLKVLGRNPTAAQVDVFLGTINPPSSWPAGSDFSYNAVLQRIAQTESQKRQFTSAGYPNWNVKPGDGGHGIMQITPPAGSPVVRANVWDWQANVRAGVQLFTAKLGAARDYARVTQKRSEFKAAVARYNVGRNPPVTVTVPELTANQRVEFAVRYYNGAGGLKDSIGRPFCHEYQLTLTPGGLLDVTLAGGSKTTGRAKWELVDWRRRKAGEPNYVSKVLGPLR